MDFENLADAVLYSQLEGKKFIVQLFENFDALLGKDFEVGEYSEEDRSKCFFFLTYDEAEDFRHNSILSTLASIVRTTTIDVDKYVENKLQQEVDSTPKIVLKKPTGD